MKLSGIRVRFAPSPTGHLHIGSLRTAIFNWLFARANNGAFLLRIEDTDIERSNAEYTQSIIKAMAWAHIDWDEPYIIQSQKIKRHQEVIEKLLAEKKAYYCDCTHDGLIARLSKKPHFNAQFIQYDRYCLNRQQELCESVRLKAIRFRLPDTPQAISWNDLIRGPITIESTQLDDFVIQRSDGTPMYNFVVVVDDADSAISHVIRGEDHIPNTPKQILLYQACGFSVPSFAHLPMILGPDGSKLSKRDAAVAVTDYIHNGYLADALINYLVRLGWSHGDQEIFSREQMIEYFNFDHVSKSGAIFNQEKLDWINGVYMRQTHDDQLLEIILKDIRSTFLDDLPQWHKETILLLINIYKQRAKTLKELIDDITQLYYKPESYQETDLHAWITDKTADHLHELIDLLNQVTSFTHDGLEQSIKTWLKEKNYKMAALAQPVRIALLGKSAGPGIFELMSVLGKKDTIERIEALIYYVKTNKR